MSWLQLNYGSAGNGGNDAKSRSGASEGRDFRDGKDRMSFMGPPDAFVENAIELSR